jgi:hypothetical protein
VNRRAMTHAHGLKTADDQAFRPVTTWWSGPASIP